MKLAIIGGGAIGQYLGYRLGSSQLPSSCDVLMYRPRRADGLIVRSIFGDKALPSFRWRSIESVDPGDYDTWIIAMKSTQMPQLASIIRRLVKPSDNVWNVQNGWGNEAWLRRATGHANIGVLSVNFGVESYADGEIAHKVGNLAFLSGLSDASTQPMMALLKDVGVDADISSSVAACRLNKLLWTIPFVGSSLVLDRYPCNLASDPDTQPRILQLMAEVAAISRRHGYDISPEQRQFLLRFTQHTSPTWPSMVQDFQASRALEIEYIYQNLLKEASRLHIATPHMRRLYHDMVDTMSQKYLHHSVSGF